jgi:hypothetical protein
MVIPTIVRMNTEVQLKINPESYLRFWCFERSWFLKVECLNPSLHNAQEWCLMKKQFQPTNTLLINWMITSVHSFNRAFTDVSSAFAVTQVAKHFRPFYKGTLIINKGFNKETGIKCWRWRCWFGSLWRSIY